ncbi:MAG: diaminopimelate decarboxylase, partial [Deltaproteobacteria bacterium]
MHLERVYEVDGKGVMKLAGHEVTELVERFGSPLVVLLEEVIRFNCRAYRKALQDNYPEGRVYYAGKAFLCAGLCKLLEQEGMWLDVVSAGEMHTARVAGFPASRMLLHGNAKTVRELEMAVEMGVGRIVIDNEAEIERLEQVARAAGRCVPVMIRVTPGVKPSTHEYVQTGQLDSKFGFNLAGGAARRAAERVLGSGQLDLKGLHCHIGSQVFSTQPFQVAARAVLEFYARLQ